jgi:hypothetical protein
MSLGNCIPGLVADGKLTKKQGERAEKAYQRHYNRLLNQMSPEAAAAAASEAALSELDFEAALRKRRTLLTIKVQQRMDADLAAFEGSPYTGLTAMLNQVDIARQRIEFQAHAKIDAFIQRHRRTLLGRTGDRTGMNDVVIELHAGATGNADAKAFSGAIGAVFESQRQRFNRAGGSIGRRADFGLPHRHDALRVRRTPYAIWRDDILDGIDTGKMIDPQTGGAFTPERLEEFLKASQRNIITGGLAGAGANDGGAARRPFRVQGWRGLAALQ